MDGYINGFLIDYLVRNVILTSNLLIVRIVNHFNAKEILQFQTHVIDLIMNESSMHVLIYLTSFFCPFIKTNYIYRLRSASIQLFLILTIGKKRAVSTSVKSQLYHPFNCHFT